MIIGLTGGIGSGKSTVATLLETLGYPVYNSDDRARYLQNNNTHLIEKTVLLLGKEVMQNGELNRSLVASMVFKDADILQQLNSLVHPFVAQDFMQWRSQQKANILFKESAILVETGLYTQCDKLVLVTAPEKVRIERVIARDGVEEKMVKLRISKQMSEEEKLKFAHFIVVNDGVELIIPQVLEIIETLKSN